MPTRSRDEMTRALAVSKALYHSGTKAEEWLRHKCRWEHMTRTAVILGYGDPRTFIDERTGRIRRANS